MPKKLNFFEAAIRNELKNYIQRGKVDIFITYEDYTESNLFWALSVDYGHVILSGGAYCNSICYFIYILFILRKDTPYLSDKQAEERHLQTITVDIANRCF